MSDKIDIGLDSTYAIVFKTEFLTMAEVARLLHRRVDSIRKMAAEGEDPIPFRIFRNQSKGPLVHRLEFFLWWQRNTVLYQSSDAAKLTSNYKKSCKRQLFDQSKRKLPEASAKKF